MKVSLLIVDHLVIFASGIYLSVSTRSARSAAYLESPVLSMGTPSRVLQGALQQLIRTSMASAYSICHLAAAGLTITPYDSILFFQSSPVPPASFSPPTIEVHTIDNNNNENGDDDDDDDNNDNNNHNS